MNRRNFVHAVGGVSGSFAFSKSERLFAQNAGWRTFELTTRGEVLKPQITSRRRNTAALRFTSAPMAGSLWIPLTCARSCSKNRPETARRMMRW